MMSSQKRQYVDDSDGIDGIDGAVLLHGVTSVQLEKNGRKKTDTLVGIGLVILLSTEEQELSYSMSSTSMLVVLLLRLSWGFS
jgi:hypothetical protein